MIFPQQLRTEVRFTLLAVAVLVSALVLGVVGGVAARERQSDLDEAIDQRGVLTGAAFDVYRSLADADTAALNAVLVDTKRALLRQRFREDLFDATDALRVAAVLAPSGPTADRVRELTDLLPEYNRLVATGWANSAAGFPVGTSYLSQASSLVRGRILVVADELRRDETAALSAARSAGGSTPWGAHVVGLAVLALLVLGQRYLARRTRRRFTLGLVVAPAATGGALGWLATGTVLAGARTDDSAKEFDDVVVPLAVARNVARQADGDEARYLILPKPGDTDRLASARASISGHLADAKERSGPGRAEIERAEAALRQWRSADRTLIEQPNPPPAYRDVVALTTKQAEGKDEELTYAEKLDEHLTAAITADTAATATSTVAARRALAGLDFGFPLLVALGALAAVAGLWPRIAEYYR